MNFKLYHYREFASSSDKCETWRIANDDKVI